jgi:hypothetical protein
MAEGGKVKRREGRKFGGNVQGRGYLKGKWGIYGKGKGWE